MPRNGSGVYSRTQPDYVFGTIIDQTAINSEYNDIGNEITNSLAADGQTNPSANLPMNGFRHLNISDAQNRNEYPSTGQIQDGAVTFATDTGAANAYVITPVPTPTANVKGMLWGVDIQNANTSTTCTLKVGAATPVSIKGQDGNDPAIGDINQGINYFTFDGTNYVLLVGAASKSPTTTQGDIIRRGASADERLAIGAADLPLVSDGTDPNYTALVLAGMAAGTQGGLIHYTGAGGVPTDSGAGNVGDVWTSNGAGADAGFAAPANVGPTLGTPQSPTTSTPVDYTVPSGTTRVILNFENLRVASTNNFQIRIGPTAGVEATGYVSTSIRTTGTTGTQQSDTTGFTINRQANTDDFNGQFIITLSDNLPKVVA